MAKVQIKAKKGFANALRPLALKIRAYLELHPFNSQHELSAEIVQLENGEDEFLYWWDDFLKNEESRSEWQAQLDVWLQKTFGGRLPKGVRSVQLRFEISEDNDVPVERDKTSGLISGEGLVEFSSIVPRYKLCDLILPNATLQCIMDALAVLECSKLIYEEWGFGNIDPVRKSVLNFYGPPGTGKTMAAHGIASHLHKRILVANFAEIESKYVGDSPKNLENIFHQSRNDDSVLFFDEADSFLGKRLTSISSSSDQAVNSLRSKLLQLLEEHDGIVIFCTNLVKNYDKAFESRILRNIKFDLPDQECRIRLIKQKIPVQVPFSDGCGISEAEMNRLVEISEGMSGREIKNAVLNTLCAAAVRKKKVLTGNDFIVGFENARFEMDAMRKERGALTQSRAVDLSKQIAENLSSGNFVEQKQHDKE